MKIVRIIGGLGNQMFQYALALAYKTRWPDEEILIDTSCFRGYKLHNGFELNRIFKLSLPFASLWNLCKLSYPTPHYRLSYITRILPRRNTMFISDRLSVVYDIALNPPKNIYLEGYWQNEKYFKPYAESEIKGEFKFPEFNNPRNIEIEQLISSHTTVSIHVRRGDYNNHPLFKGICDLEYYRKAINYIDSNRKIDYFLIFSNDIEWCKNNIFKDYEGRCIFIDWNNGSDSFQDMHLMSLCNHNIIANSSFSWWGAWLNNNPDKIVIAPKHWVNKEVPVDPICDDWIRI